MTRGVATRRSIWLGGTPASTGALDYTFVVGELPEVPAGEFAATLTCTAI